jgi:Cu-Zn family superoxide dismutase
LEIPLHSLTNIDNPTNVSHGGPNDAERHIGDWGNIDVDQDPYMLNIRDHVAKLTGPYGIVGVSMSLGILESISF